MRSEIAKGSQGRLTLWTGGVFALLYFTALALTTLDLHGGVKVAASAAAVAAFGAFLWAEIGMMRGLDELEQRIQLEALAVAFPSSLGLIMLLGLLQRFVTLPVQDLSYRHIWPLMILLYFLGLIVARGRYQ